MRGITIVSAGFFLNFSYYISKLRYFAVGFSTCIVSCYYFLILMTFFKNWDLVLTRETHLMFENNLISRTILFFKVFVFRSTKSTPCGWDKCLLYFKISLPVKVLWTLRYLNLNFSRFHLAKFKIVSIAVTEYEC